MFQISAFYKLPDGKVVEKRLRKGGEVKLFSSEAEAINTAEKMLPLLPKAYQVCVFSSGLGTPVKTFKR